MPEPAVPTNQPAEGSEASGARVAARAATRHWLEQAVIGLGLCPFAGPAVRAGRLRMETVGARPPEALLEAFALEARRLADAGADGPETTLLVVTDGLEDFEDFNDFLDPVDDLLDALGLEDTIQVAPFHPRFRFAGLGEDDPQNCSHRAPWPTLHLLRRASLTLAQAQVDEIIARNERTLSGLGLDGWARLMARAVPGRAA